MTMANIRKLSPALAKKAVSELNECPERIDEDLEKFKDWIKKQPHLKVPTDDQFLIAFLRGSKFSLEKAKEKLDLFFSVRTMIPELCKNRDPTVGKTLDIIKLGTALPLPLTNGEDGPRFFLIRPGTYDPHKYSIRDIMKCNTLITDIMMMEDDNFVIGGQVGILDLTNVSKAHFLQFDLSFIKKMTMLGQEASPFRQKGFHYVNTPSAFETIFNMFKGFMSEKNKSRLYVHGSDMDSLYRYVPKKFLPAEYGGEAGPIQNIIDEWEKKIISYRNFFIEWEEYGTNEKLRPGKPRSEESLFGVDGTFRKLNVD